MLAYLLTQSARVLAGEPGHDHIEEVAIVANFLAKAESGKVDITDVEIVNRANSTENTTLDLLDYVRECSIKEISAVSSSDRSLPLSVHWDCGRYIEVNGKPKWEDRRASFWVKQGRIMKIAFGEGEPLVIPTTFRSESNPRSGLVR